MSRLMERAVRRGQANVRQALRAVLVRLDATRKLPPAQVTALQGEQLAVELMQHYGFASAPLSGAELVVLPLGGVSSHGVIIASVDGRYRIVLQPGEVAIHTDEGDHVHLKRGRVMEFVTETAVFKAGTKVRFETPTIEATGNVTAEGNIHADQNVSDAKRSMQADRDIYNQHKHPETGGTTKTPIQQQ